MAKVRQTGPDLFDETPDLDDDAGPAETVAAPVTSKRGDKSWAELTCRTCGRTVWLRYLKSKGVPTQQCCGDLLCDALQNWTAEEWELRARSAHLHRPAPPAPFTPAGGRTPLRTCIYCGTTMVYFVVPLTLLGHDRALACTKPGCRWVASTHAHRLSPSELIDLEAKRRYPVVLDRWRVQLPSGPAPVNLQDDGTGHRAPAPDFDWPPGPPGSLLAPDVPTAPAAQLPSSLTSAEPTVPPGPVQSLEAPIPSWGSTYTCDLCGEQHVLGAEVTGHITPIPVDETVDSNGLRTATFIVQAPGPRPLPDDAIICARPVSPAPRPLSKPAGTVCQLVGRAGGKLFSKCGREVKTSAKVVGPAEAGMSAWDAQVNCEACRAALGWPPNAP